MEFITANIFHHTQPRAFEETSCIPPEMFLSDDVQLDSQCIPYRVAIRNAHRKCALTLLPREIFHANRFVNPPRRSLFDVLHKCRKRMSRAQTSQQMSMIRRPANGFRNRICRAN